MNGDVARAHRKGWQEINEASGKNSVAGANVVIGDVITAEQCDGPRDIENREKQGKTREK